jgi:hypothetical protein
MITDNMLKDSRGRLVPVDQVRPIDLERDDLVRRITARFELVRRVCTEFRTWADQEIDAFLQISQERYGIKSGGQVGNLTLTTYDGEIRILRAVQKQLAFTDEIHAAKRLIDECLVEWCQGAKPELKALVDDAFKTDTKGDLAADRVLGLRRLKIEDPRWKLAMEAIADSIQVTATRAYIRFYRRQADGSYNHVPAGV